jgi:hypothetical protein
MELKKKTASPVITGPISYPAHFVPPTIDHNLACCSTYYPMFILYLHSAFTHEKQALRLSCSSSNNK